MSYLSRILRKARREILVLLSKLCVKSATISYRGLGVKIPLLYGIGRYHFVPPENRWMRDVIELSHKLYPDKAVVDVGVNVGQFLLELKAINGKAPYYGFEPNPACVFYIFELIRLNRFASTYVFPVAVADEDRISYLFSSAWDSGTSTLVQEFSKGREEFSTTVYSVNGDEIFDSIDEEISLIKIDVEGFEYNVLSGLAGTLKKYRPLVFCEINISLHESDNLKLMKSKLEDTHSLMKSLNYIPCGTGFSGERVVIDDVDAYSGLLSDYLFVPAEIMENVQEHFSNQQGQTRGPAS